MSNLNLMKLLNHPLTRTDAVKRYSCTKLVEDESLAQHITEVSTLCYIIACELKKLGEDIDTGVLLEKCLLHDADEVITGDIPRNTKYVSNDVHEVFEDVAYNSVYKLTRTVAGGHNKILETWTQAKHGKEGLILKLVDMLCVVRKALTEVELLGNKHALKIIVELSDHLTGLYKYLCDSDNDFVNHASISYLMNLVTSARLEVNNVLEDNKEFINKYELDSNILKRSDK